MTLINDILEYNTKFVESKKYEPLRTDRFPNKRLVILTCMDTRLVELLPQSMDLHNGDVKIIKNAGGIVTHPFGSVMRSILVAIYELGARDVAIIGHHDCGMGGLNCSKVLERAKKRGVPDAVVATIKNSGIDLQKWLTGFVNVTDAVRESVQLVRSHPLMPNDVFVHGLVIHPETGKLELVVDGYAESAPQA